jgi:hypothetical protein
MVTKSIYRKHELKMVACVEMINHRRISSSAHITAKGILNMTTSFLLLCIAIYVTATSTVCYKPFFGYHDTIGSAMCFLLAVCIFNMVLLLLTESLSLRNIHEIPMYMVTSLVSIAIIVKQENAIAGVVSLFMFGSVLSDELYNVRSISLDATTRKSNKGVHIFRVAMHILCNTMFPVVVFFVPAWYTQEKFFAMDKSSIIIFFFAVTFFVICNAWRLNFVLKQLFRKPRVQQSNEEIVVQCEKLANGNQLDRWCPNASISAVLVPMLKNKLKSLPTKIDVESLFKNPSAYIAVERKEKPATDPAQTRNIIYKPSALKTNDKSDTSSEKTLEKIDIDAVF